MEKFKIIISWFVVLLVMVLIFISFISILLSPLPPIRFAHIPRETIDFINHITDQRIIINKNPEPDDWKNDKTGKDYLANYKSLEDANFIIYYLPNTKAENRAKVTLTNANAAINPLEQLMGVYYYPNQVNNRKLPIYVTNSDNEYNAMIQHFVHSDGNGTAGITCFEISSYGFRTLGIVLSKEIWEDKNENIARMVLWHEMNHYVFYTSIDIEKNPAPLKWVIEGVAEYFAKNTTRLIDVDKKKCYSINLAEELKNNLDNYWVGYTAMLCAEKSFGKSLTNNFIRQNYISPVKPSIKNIFKIDITNFEKDWRSYVAVLP